MVVDITSCFKLDDDDEMSEEQNIKKASPSKRDDKILTILEALPAHMGWKQIFNLLEEMREQLIIGISKVTC